MAYRPSRRVWGETSLERKCFFLFGACTLLLIFGSFYFYGSLTERLVWRESRRERGRLLVDTIWALEHWKALETNEKFKKEVVAKLINTRDTRDYSWEPIRPAANRLEGRGKPKDQFEEALLVEFAKPPPSSEKDQALLFKEREIPDKQEYVYYQPIYASQTCVDCHRINWQNKYLAENDLLSIISVRLPMHESSQAGYLNWGFLWFTGIITVFLSMVALYVIVRYVIVKPLKHLRDVSDEISRGNITLRADIHTNDEFEQLGTAFNRMLQKILDSTQELRHLNDDLDAKVDELAQANMRLFEMNRLKSDFLATMSHELRTPLNSIIGFSDVLNSIESLDSKQRRYVQNIQKSGRLLLEMINDILDLAKIESGKMELNLSQFRVDSVIVAQCDMARPLAERKNIDLTTHIDPEIPELFQDQPKLQQILNNLLSNAIKFTPEGGRVDVSARAVPRERLELVVSDTGVGIAESDQTVIFEKFRQGTTVLSGGDAMTREYSGTGLGLSIVKELCKLLGGEISLVSQLGNGSTFTVRIPLVREEQPRLDSPLASELDELAKPPRPELHRLREEPLSSATHVVE